MYTDARQRVHIFVYGVIPSDSCKLISIPRIPRVTPGIEFKLMKGNKWNNYAKAWHPRRLKAAEREVISRFRFPRDKYLADAPIIERAVRTAGRLFNESR